MKLLVDKTERIRVVSLDYDNGWSVVVCYKNNRVDDCYFSKTENLFPDGSLKDSEQKFIYIGKDSGVDITAKLDFNEFKDFANLTKKQNKNEE